MSSQQGCQPQSKQSPLQLIKGSMTFSPLDFEKNKKLDQTIAYLQFHTYVPFELRNFLILVDVVSKK